jgi:hypothetical protein
MSEKEWEEFKERLREIRDGINAWLVLRKPIFERWAKEGREGIHAFAIAVVRGEEGRERAMSLNTGNDQTSVIGFNLGLVEHDAFWIVMSGLINGKKLPEWIKPLLAAIFNEIKNGK